MNINEDICILLYLSISHMVPPRFTWPLTPPGVIFCKPTDFPTTQSGSKCVLCDYVDINSNGIHIFLTRYAGLICRARASCAGEWKLSSRSSQTNDLSN